MTAACRDHPAFRDSSRRASPPITDDEATRHLRGVLERAGEAEVKCQRKQYGPAGLRSANERPLRITASTFEARPCSSRSVIA